MTTISYHHKDKEIAVDSRTTCGGVIVDDNAVKIIKKEGHVFATCGTVGDDIKLIDLFLSGSNENINIDANAIVSCSRGIFKIGMNEDDGLWENELTYSFALGSGEKWAISAMDFGCSAKDAVKYAATRDIYTGGKVRVFKVK